MWIISACTLQKLCNFTRSWIKLDRVGRKKPFLHQRGGKRWIIVGKSWTFSPALFLCTIFAASNAAEAEGCNRFTARRGKRLPFFINRRMGYVAETTTIRTKEQNNGNKTSLFLCYHAEITAVGAGTGDGRVEPRPSSIFRPPRRNR